MKKTVLASTLAVGLGVTGIAAGNSADASIVLRFQLRDIHFDIQVVFQVRSI